MKVLNILASVSIFLVFGTLLAWLIIRLSFQINDGLGVKDSYFLLVTIPYLLSFGVGIFFARKFYLYLIEKEKSTQLYISIPLVLLLAGATFADWFLTEKPESSEDILINLYIEGDVVRIEENTVSVSSIESSLTEIIKEKKLRNDGLVIVHINDNSSAIMLNKSIGSIKSVGMPYTVFEN